MTGEIRQIILFGNNRRLMKTPHQSTTVKNKQIK